MEKTANGFTSSLCVNPYIVIRIAATAALNTAVAIKIAAFPDTLTSSCIFSFVCLEFGLPCIYIV
jgi:hypothetical protein